MTCIVGLVENDKVYMGADSMSASDYQAFIRKDAKLFRNGPFLIGGTDSFRMLDLLRYSLELPDLPDDVEDDDCALHRYMATEFIDAVRETLGAGGFKKIENGVEHGGHFLVGVRGRLFEIYEDFQVGESLDSYAAVGCGAELALGSLHTTNSSILPMERLELALLAAEHHSTFVKRPFLYLVSE